MTSPLINNASIMNDTAHWQSAIFENLPVMDASSTVPRSLPGIALLTEPVDEQASAVALSLQQLYQALRDWSCRLKSDEEVSTLFTNVAARCNDLFVVCQRQVDTLQSTKESSAALIASLQDVKQLVAATDALRSLLETVLDVDQIDEMVFEKHDPLLRSTMTALLEAVQQKQAAFRLWRMNGRKSESTRYTTNDEMQPQPNSMRRGSSLQGLAKLALKDENTVTIRKLFLSIDDMVRAVSYNGPITLPALQMLFVDTFQYHPGRDDFPVIYVKDKEANVFYELTDLKDVCELAHLKLNTQFGSNNALAKLMEQGFATLQKELRDVRRALIMDNNTVRGSQGNLNGGGNLSRAYTVRKHASNGALAEPQSLKRSASKSLSSFDPPPMTPMTPLSPTLPQTPISTVPVQKLQQQVLQVQELRRDVATLKQVAEEFKFETLQNLRDFAQQFKQEIQKAEQKSALDQPAMARALLVESKQQIVSECEDVSKRLDDLQEIMEELKRDVMQRKCLPSEARMNIVLTESLALQSGLVTLSEQLADMKPIWKSTWETELKNIVQEQQLLKEKTALIDDLEQDHQQLLETLQSLQQIVDLQKQGAKSGNTKFIPPPMDSGHQGLNTVLQEMVNAVDTNSERRLKAIALSTQLRQKELEAQNEDEFEKELHEFVHGKKWNRTGGIQEVERLRAKKDADNLRASLKQ